MHKIIVSEDVHKIYKSSSTNGNDFSITRKNENDHIHQQSDCDSDLQSQQPEHTEDDSLLFLQGFMTDISYIKQIYQVLNCSHLP
jgi:hypothetical protein